MSIIWHCNTFRFHHIILPHNRFDQRDEEFAGVTCDPAIRAIRLKHGNLLAILC